MPKKIFAVVLLLNIFIFASNIQIKLLNGLNKQPVPFAKITDENNSVIAIADDNGYFKISDNLSIIYISHIGFENKKIDLRELKTNEILLEPRNYLLKSIIVTSTINKDQISPVSQSFLSENLIKQNYTIQDIPQYLSTLPSISAYSENGNGIGYNYLRIRGFDQRRIAVAVNGVPQNDPEDHNVYWIDMPDLLSNSELLQVQKGAGKSAFGYPAIGGTINIITKNYSFNPYYKLGYSRGSFNTEKKSFEYSSGLINDKYTFLAKFSNVSSDGYRNNSWTNLYSYYLSSTFFLDNIQNTINIYGGIVNDGLSYNGIIKSAIKDKDLRKENLSYWEGNDNIYTYKQKRRSDEIENFIQPHYELITNWKINDNFKLSNVAFVVVGEGYFDYDGSWGDTTYYRLTSSNGFNPTANPQNTLIRAWVKNRQFGLLPKLEVTHDKGELTLGLELRKHNSIHFGNINFAENLPANVTKDYRYYEYKGQKDIYSFFVNEKYNFTEKFSTMLELQVLYNKYRLYDEKYIGTDFTVDNFFLNPKVILNYNLSYNQNVYLSYANVSREPRLKEYYDAAESSAGEVPKFEYINGVGYNFDKPLVKPEKMNDFELGYNLFVDNLSFSLNGYYMLFNDEIVKNGTLDRFGQPNTGNMPRTLHAGVEFSVSYEYEKYLNFILNGNISQNKIKEGKYYYYNKTISKTEFVDLKDNSVAGFPDNLFNFIIKYNNYNIYSEITFTYSGKFYTDNFGDKLKDYQTIPGFKIKYKDNKNDEYFVTNLFFSYKLNINNVEMNPFLQINNVFNQLYSTNGVGKEFYPAAERNFLIGLNVKI